MKNLRTNRLLSITTAGLMAAGIAGWGIATAADSETDHSGHHPTTEKAKEGAMKDCPMMGKMMEAHGEMDGMHSDGEHMSMNHGEGMMHGGDSMGCGGGMEAMMEECGMMKEKKSPAAQASVYLEKAGELNLSEEQKATLQKVANGDSQNEVQKKQLADAEKELEKLIADDTVAFTEIEKQVRQIENLRANAKIFEIRQQRELNKVVTPDLAERLEKVQQSKQTSQAITF